PRAVHPQLLLHLRGRGPGRDGGQVRPGGSLHGARRIGHLGPAGRRPGCPARGGASLCRWVTGLHRLPRWFLVLAGRADRAPPGHRGVAGMTSAEAVAERVEEVRGVVARQGRDPKTVRIVAVTKGFGPDAVAAAVAAGVADVGENYAQEL